MPRCTRADHLGDIGNQSVSYANIRFQVERLHLKECVLTMCFRIYPTDQGSTMQDGQSKVSVASLRSGSIAFKRVIKVEEHSRAFTIPHQRVERRE